MYPRHETFFVLMVIGAGVKALVGEGGGSIPVALRLFLLGCDCAAFGWVLLLARAALGVFGRNVWAGGARGTVERGCDQDARPWIKAEDRRPRVVQSI